VREGRIRGNKLSNILFIKNKNGFSLIEMMIVVTILGIIILGLVTFFTGGTRSWVTGQHQLEAQRNARLSMDQMVREIREADYIVDSSISSSIDFHTPFHGNISYSLSGNDLKRDSNTVINNVLTLDFSYFDNSGSEINGFPLSYEDASKISKVHINFQVDVDQDSSPDITLNSDINLRNHGL
jgi:prepilin-type N-terminal cleavage/methylation domain-containing protein